MNRNDQRHPSALPVLMVVRHLPEPFSAAQVYDALIEARAEFSGMDLNAISKVLYGWRARGFVVKSRRGEHHWEYARAAGFEGLLAALPKHRGYRPVALEKLPPMERAWRLFRATFEEAVGV